MQKLRPGDHYRCAKRGTVFVWSDALSNMAAFAPNAGAGGPQEKYHRNAGTGVSNPRYFRGSRV